MPLVCCVRACARTVGAGGRGEDEQEHPAVGRIEWIRSKARHDQKADRPPARPTTTTSRSLDVVLRVPRNACCVALKCDGCGVNGLLFEGVVCIAPSGLTGERKCPLQCQLTHLPTHARNTAHRTHIAHRTHRARKHAHTHHRTRTTQRQTKPRREGGAVVGTRTG